MASTPSYVDAGRLRADTCGPGVLNRLFEGQRYMVVRYSDHSPRAIRVTCRPATVSRLLVSTGRPSKRAWTDARVGVYERLVGFRVVLWPQSAAV